MVRVAISEVEDSKSQFGTGELLRLRASQCQKVSAEQ